VASDILPHREFGGDAVIYFPLDDDDAMVAAVATALDDGAAPDPTVVQDLSIPSAAERFHAVLSPLLR
jgi:hypothetical protein